MLSAEEILNYINNYTKSGNEVKDKNNNVITDQAIIDKYNNSINIYNEIFNYVSTTKTDLTVNQILKILEEKINNDPNFHVENYSSLRETIDQAVKQFIESTKKQIYPKKEISPKVNEILNYVNNYSFCVLDRFGKEVKDDKIVNHYQDYYDSVKIYNEAMSIKNQTNTTKTVKELIEEVKNRINLTEERKITLSAEEILNYKYNYSFILLDKKNVWVINDKIINNYCNALTIYNEALAKQIQNPNVPLEYIIDDIINQNQMKADSLVTPSPRPLSAEGQELKVDSDIAKLPEENPEPRSESTSASEPEKAAESKSEPASTPEPEKTAESKSESASTPEPNKNPTPAENQPQDNTRQDESNSQISPQRVASSEKTLAPGLKRTVVERRLKHWEKKTKTSLISFILRGENDHTEDYAKIYESIAIVEAHLYTWTFEKVEQSIQIIKNDIQASTQLEEKEREKLKKECKKLEKKLENNRIMSVRFNYKVENSESLPEKNAKSIDSNGKVPNMNVRNVISDNVAEAKDKEKELEPQEIIVTNEGRIKEIKERYDEYSNKLNRIDKIAEKSALVSFILRKANNHTETYQKILENITVLNAHYPFWTMEKIKECINIIDEDIKAGEELLRPDEERKLKKLNRKLRSELKYNEIERIRNKHIRNISEIVADLPFRRVINKFSPNSIEEPPVENLFENNEHKEGAEENQEQNLEKTSQENTQNPSEKNSKNDFEPITPIDVTPKAAEGNLEENASEADLKKIAKILGQKDESTPVIVEDENISEQSHDNIEKPIVLEKNKPENADQSFLDENKKSEEKEGITPPVADVTPEENINPIVTNPEKQPAPKKSPSPRKTSSKPRKTSSKTAPKGKEGDSISNSSINSFEEYKKAVQSIPKLTKEVFDRLSVEEQNKYLNMMACKAYFCNDFISILGVLQYYQGLNPEDLENEHSPFAR